MTATTSSPQIQPGRARLAGFFYLAIIALGIWSEMAVRDMLIVPGDGPATMANILAAGSLFNLSLLADIGMILSDIAVGILLFMLFRAVSPGIALAAMILRLTQAVVLAANLLFQVGAMVLLRMPEAAGTFGEAQTAWAVQALLDVQGQGYDLGLVFFGINCLLTGWLIVKSGFVPRVLGAGITASGLVYLAGSGFTLIGESVPMAVAVAYLLPFVAELGFALWLVSRGWLGRAPIRGGAGR